MKKQSRSLFARAEEVEGKKLPLDDEARAALARMADGDGRAADARGRSLARCAQAGEVFDAERLQERRAAPRADLRQVAGRPLQSDLGAA
jgi:putative ATPase